MAADFFPLSPLTAYGPPCSVAFSGYVMPFWVQPKLLVALGRRLCVRSQPNAPTAPKTDLGHPQRGAGGASRQRTSRRPPVAAASARRRSASTQSG